jgi:hypothetical protein
MKTQIGVAARLMAAILLFGLAIFCGYGFLASYELGFPNVFHFLYGAIGLAEVASVAWLVLPAFKWPLSGTADPQWRSYWRPARLAALFSLISLTAPMTGRFPTCGSCFSCCS